MVKKSYWDLYGPAMKICGSTFNFRALNSIFDFSALISVNLSKAIHSLLNIQRKLLISFLDF